MKKVLTVVGARPQFIKAAPVRRALAGCVREVLVHTGQHHDAAMSDVFFDQLGLGRPDHHLGVGSAPHGRQIGRMLGALEEVYEQERPDAVLVYGDTNSTLAGALAATRMQIPVVHVEAGVRSFNWAMPEEQNRVLVDRMADLLLVPNLEATAQLKREAVRGHIVWIGDVMLDALRHVRGALAPDASWAGRPGRRLVVTLHRAENVDDPDRLRRIVAAVAHLVDHGWTIVWPLHPRVLARAAGTDLAPLLDRLGCAPVDYMAMQALLAGADAVLTDSGGLQKEAAYLEVPCVTLRTETEWTDTVELGLNRLVSPDADDALAQRLAEALAAWPERASMPWARYAMAAGDGRAAARLAEAVVEFLG
ncbi:MAG: UDP-N-acetylglucosamine 2-epimerase (non-hydrolyzing) [Candidatus Sericytochromatia bacterium]|nr:UDP-N-acetylglucosamine 2-epimerase (non-hydrolyzing) [Candidatus Sericytochromatia bacterium]